MKCPVCNNIDLRMAERQGIEIDYCPQCRGVWLDRGELDKIIERSLHIGNSIGAQPQTSRHSEYSDYEDNEHRRRTSTYSDYDDDKHGKQKKKRGFLDNLFDFD